MQIDFRNKRPLSEQIREEIQRLIETGELAPGDPLPTVRQLASQLGVNFNTVARAYRELDQQARIVTRQGRGTFVASSGISTEPDAASRVKDELLALITRLEKYGLSRDTALEQILQIIGGEYSSVRAGRLHGRMLGKSLRATPERLVRQAARRQKRTTEPGKRQERKTVKPLRKRASARK